MQTIVIGHKNPDMDSICSALAYAHLKRVTGTPNVIAARAGNTNERIDFVLAEIRRRAAGLHQRSLRSGERRDGARRDLRSRPIRLLYDAIHLLEKRRLRGLPVVDERPAFSRFALRLQDQPSPLPAAGGSGAGAADHRAALQHRRTFGGEVVTGELPDETTEYLLMIGAMSAETFAARLQTAAPRSSSCSSSAIARTFKCWRSRRRCAQSS